MLIRRIVIRHLCVNGITGTHIQKGKEIETEGPKGFQITCVGKKNAVMRE
jgi:hypothetical protein